MNLKSTAAALCAALALSTLSVGVAEANDKKIAVTAKFNDTTEVKHLTPGELATMLKGLGLDQATVDKSVAAAQKEGRMTLQARLNKAAPKK